MHKRYIVGIDEVGRGCLAGPVTVTAALFRSGENFFNDFYIPLKDSKKLSSKKREEWVKFLKRNKNKKNIFFSTKSISAKTIDKIGIVSASNKAATKALSMLLKKTNFSPSKIFVYLDGGLFIEKKINELKKISSQTIIRGDEKIPAISLASIFAKVHRDNYMKMKSYNFPGYDFEKHKGYGTKKHIKLIKKNGPSKFHRLTFLRNLIV